MQISMTTHVSRTVSSCFAALCHIRSIRRSVSQPVFLSLVTSLVLSRLDYGRVTLNGITRRLMDRLQSVLNTAARLVYNSRKYSGYGALGHVPPRLLTISFLDSLWSRPKADRQILCSLQDQLVQMSTTHIRSVLH